MTATTEGAWRVGVASDGPAPVTVDAEADGQMTLTQARAFARALVEVAALAEASTD